MRLILNIRMILKKKGLIFSAISPDGSLPEIIELKDHPWFIGVQFHPEFKSRPFTPHPLFSSFIKAAGINGRSQLMISKSVKCGKLNISNTSIFTLIAGPCQLENEKHALRCCYRIKKNY